MELGPKGLEGFLERASEDDELKAAFPDPSFDYWIHYQSLKQNLEHWVHNNVTEGAISVDGGRLTKHGRKHIASVTRRASELLESRNCSINAYEALLLACAIQLHDIGNILGRKEHEKKIGAILQSFFGTSLGFQPWELATIRRIAQVHGGRINGRSDTLSHLEKEVAGGHSRHRPRFLAAVLRLADELSDDHLRADKLSLELGALPKASEIFHKYASGIRLVRPDHASATIDIHFYYHKADFLRKYGKDQQEVFLIDEILIRTFKMFNEMKYCVNFFGGCISFENISVKIEIDDEQPESIHPLMTIAYRMRDHAYPDEAEGGIYDVAAELNRFCKDGRLTGVSLARVLSEGGLNE